MSDSLKVYTESRMLASRVFKNLQAASFWDVVDPRIFWQRLKERIENELLRLESEDVQ